MVAATKMHSVEAVGLAVSSLVKQGRVLEPS